MSVINSQQRTFLEEQGYLIVPDAVPPHNLRAATNAIWDFLGMNPDDPDDWYRSPHKASGTVEIYHHQALWDNRQHPRMHQIFSELMGTEKLWVSEDRAGMKPPARPEFPAYDHHGFTLLGHGHIAAAAGAAATSGRALLDGYR